ncbi:hypothetical protein Tco_0605764 [Tanacetum coccineum]
MVSTVKLHILKKGEYTLWSIRMEQYLTNTDYSLWQVILNGDGPIQVTTNDNGVETEVSSDHLKLQNVAFLSVEDTSSSNEVNTANGVSTASGHNSQGQASSSSYTDDLMFSFFANLSNSPQLDDEDLEQIGHDDLEEMDLKWQVLLKLRLNALTVIEGAILNALIVQNGLGYDWSYIAQDEPTEFDLMAYTSNSSSANTEVQSCSKNYVKTYEKLQKQFDEQRQTLSKANLEIIAYQLGLESVEAQLVVHQKNEVVYEEKIAVLEFEGTRTSLLIIKNLMDVLLLLVEVLEMVKIHTDNNVADLLTKAFDRCFLDEFEAKFVISRISTARLSKAVWLDLVSIITTKSLSGMDYTGGGDSVERAITTAASLDAAQDSGSLRHQDTMGDAPAQTRSEIVLEQPIEPPLSEGHTSGSRAGRMEHQFELTANVPITPHDSPLLGGYTLGSDEGRLKLHELMTMCIKLSKQVFDLEKKKDDQAVEILRLTKRVKRLERQRTSSTSQPRRRKYRQVESLDDDLDEKDASKQGRSIHTLFMDGTPMEINMLIEKNYLLIKELLEKMLNLQLEAEEESTMAFKLIKFIKSMLEE